MTGAFVSIMAQVMDAKPRTHFGTIMLVAMGLLLGNVTPMDRPKGIDRPRGFRPSSSGSTA